MLYDLSAGPGTGVVVLRDLDFQGQSSTWKYLSILNYSAGTRTRSYHLLVVLRLRTWLRGISLDH